MTIGNSRGPESLAGLVAEIGDRAHAATAAGAASAGEVVVAIPTGRYLELPAAQLAGKIVVDAGTTTSSELLAASLDGARVVKAFNTIYFEHLHDHGTPAGSPGRRGLPMAGDDVDAKRTVASLIDSSASTSTTSAAWPTVGASSRGRPCRPVTRIRAGS